MLWCCRILHGRPQVKKHQPNLSIKRFDDIEAFWFDFTMNPSALMHVLDCNNNLANQLQDFCQAERATSLKSFIHVLLQIHVTATVVDCKVQVVVV